jgi:hypothetical protein
MQIKNIHDKHKVAFVVDWFDTIFGKEEHSNDTILQFFFHFGDVPAKISMPAGIFCVALRVALK